MDSTAGSGVDELAYAVDRDGAYVWISPGMRELLGHAPSEVGSLHVGSVTGQPEPLARALWRRFQAGRFLPPLGDATLLHTRDERRIPATFLGVEETSPGVFTLRYRLAGPEVADRVRQAAAPDLLAAWREAERRVAALAPDARDRPAALEDLADWRLIFQEAQAKARPDR